MILKMGKHFSRTVVAIEPDSILSYPTTQATRLAQVCSNRPTPPSDF